MSIKTDLSKGTIEVDIDTYNKLEETIVKKDFEISRLQDEKQNLIKYLEDKIEESKKKVKEYNEEMEWKWQIWEEHYIKIYQEILDKVKEGNYEQ